MLFHDRIEQALAQLDRNIGFAVLCLDLDRFKVVNDTLGHPVGDVLLRQVADRLLACVREGDTVARLGGDEFAIVLLNITDPAAVDALASRIIDRRSARTTRLMATRSTSAPASAWRWPRPTDPYRMSC